MCLIDPPPCFPLNILRKLSPVPDPPFTVLFTIAPWARYSIFLQVRRINGTQPQNFMPPLSRKQNTSN